MIKESIEPRISAIAAIGSNGELGASGKLLWHLPEDFKHFKEKTLGKPIIMGSKTFESIGKALPGRLNIVLTNQEDYEAEGCIVAHSLEFAVEVAKKHTKETRTDEIFIIGGGNVYKQAIDEGVVSRLYLTLVDSEFPEADTFFPEHTDFTRVIEQRDGAESSESGRGKTFNYKFVTIERDDNETE